MGGNRTQRYTGKNTKALVVGLFLGLAGFGSSLHAQQQEILLDRLVAEVNGEPIAYSEIMDKVKNGPLVEVAAYPAEESDPPFDVALQDLINRKLIMQKAEEYEIEVTDEELDQEIKNFLDKRHLTEEGLKSAIAQQGLTMEEYRRDFRNQIILSQFQGRVILPSVKITDKDIEVYYLKTSGNTAENLKLQLRQIFVKLDPDVSETVKKGKEELVKTIMQKLEGGMAFEEAVKIYSDDPNGRDNGGLMPLIYLRDMAAPFQKVIEPLKEGETSEPIKTAQGYYIFHLQNKAFAGNTEYTGKKRELEMQLRQEEVGRQTMRWLSDERKRSKIKIISDQVASTKN